MKMEYEIEDGNGFLECKFPEYPVIPKKDAEFTRNERNDMWDDFDGYEDYDSRK